MHASHHAQGPELKIGPLSSSVTLKPSPGFPCVTTDFSPDALQSAH